MTSCLKFCSAPAATAPPLQRLGQRSDRLTSLFIAVVPISSLRSGTIRPASPDFALQLQGSLNCLEASPLPFFNCQTPEPSAQGVVESSRIYLVEYISFPPSSPCLLMQNPTPLVIARVHSCHPQQGSPLGTDMPLRPLNSGSIRLNSSSSSSSPHLTRAVSKFSPPSTHVWRPPKL